MPSMRNEVIEGTLTAGGEPVKNVAYGCRNRNLIHAYIAKTAHRGKKIIASIVQD